MPTTSGELWVRCEQTVASVQKRVHQSQGSIIFSSRRAGTESGHSWFLYRRAVEALIQKQSKGIFIQQPWVLLCGFCIPVGAALSIYMKIVPVCIIMPLTTTTTTKTTKAFGLICKQISACSAEASLTVWEAFVDSDESVNNTQHTLSPVTREQSHPLGVMVLCHLSVMPHQTVAKQARVQFFHWVSETVDASSWVLGI